MMKYVLLGFVNLASGCRENVVAKNHVLRFNNEWIKGSLELQIIKLTKFTFQKRMSYIRKESYSAEVGFDGNDFWLHLIYPKPKPEILHKNSNTCVVLKVRLFRHPSYASTLHKSAHG